MLQAPPFDLNQPVIGRLLDRYPGPAGKAGTAHARTRVSCKLGRLGRTHGACGHGLMRCVRWAWAWAQSMSAHGCTLRCGAVCEGSVCALASCVPMHAVRALITW